MKIAEIGFGGDGSAFSVYTENHELLCENLFDEIENYLYEKGFDEDEICEMSCGGENSSKWWETHYVLLKELFEKNDITHIIDVENETPDPTPYEKYIQIYLDHSEYCTE